ncbi:sulfite exporter TauE/SafE family protein [Hydrogenophaga taeniospiralis]|uniref:sulfite exporter TauE/SafE family protein n=1 Tax=Hydrogenophaga taeniospiralis TaxID=65656 RepID=UPI001CFA0F16|nr:sulfite exporter TauE/SafE family protein [Hydrogenophaga taeniospiralis]UCU94958.1 sulfite exporter TauE/SafE family protein [Hydrogenophaga taeniospiralis]
MNDGLLGDAPGILAIGTLIVGLSGVVKGAMGVGMGMIAVPLLSLLVSPSQAIGLMVMPVLLSNLSQAAEGGSPLYCLKRFRWLIALQLLAMVLTVWLTSQLLPNQLELAFAGAILMLVLLMASRPNFVVQNHQEGWVGGFAGVMAGLLGGISSLTSPILISYLMALKLTRDEFIRSISVIYLFGSVSMYASMLWFGRFGWTEVALSCFAVVPMLLGLFVGKRIRSRLSEEMFRVALLLFLGTLALTLLCK